jgi:hypothetical protein
MMRITMRLPAEPWDHVSLSIPRVRRFIERVRYYRSVGYRCCVWPPYG